MGLRIIKQPWRLRRLVLWRELRWTAGAARLSTAERYFSRRMESNSLFLVFDAIFSKAALQILMHRAPEEPLST
eukprot:SAG25_NODE_13305_length_269_cov_0.547059_1_plen_73_part_01